MSQSDGIEPSGVETSTGPDCPVPGPTPLAKDMARSPSSSLPQSECIDCAEGLRRNEYPHSERECGHHCNCSWESGECHWCGALFGDVDRDDFGVPNR